METLEQINQLTQQLGVLQTSIILILVAVVAYIVFSVRSMYVMSRGTSKQGEITAMLAKLLEINSEKSEERWHNKMESYDKSRTETGNLINDLQKELREVTNNNYYGKGVIETITNTYKEYREKAEDDKVAMRNEVDLLKRRVEENERTIQEQLVSSAEKDKVIAEQDKTIAEQDKTIATLELEQSDLKSELAKLKEVNDKPQVPDESKTKDNLKGE